MAMENKRITQLSTERLNLTSGDYVMVDDADNGSAKYRLDRLKETDSTLSVSGKAADAAATGQAISDETTARENADNALDEDIGDLKSAINQAAVKGNLLFTIGSLSGTSWPYTENNSSKERIRTPIYYFQAGTIIEISSGDNIGFYGEKQPLVSFTNRIVVTDNQLGRILVRKTNNETIQQSDIPTLVSYISFTNPPFYTIFSSNAVFQRGVLNGTEWPYTRTTNNTRVISVPYYFESGTLLTVASGYKIMLFGEADRSSDWVDSVYIKKGQAAKLQICKTDNTDFTEAECSTVASVISISHYLPDEYTNALIIDNTSFPFEIGSLSGSVWPYAETNSKQRLRSKPLYFEEKTTIRIEDGYGIALYGSKQLINTWQNAINVEKNQAGRILIRKGADENLTDTDISVALNALTITKNYIIPVLADGVIFEKGSLRGTSWPFPENDANTQRIRTKAYYIPAGTKIDVQSGYNITLCGKNDYIPWANSITVEKSQIARLLLRDSNNAILGPDDIVAASGLLTFSYDNFDTAPSVNVEKYSHTNYSPINYNPLTAIKLRVGTINIGKFNYGSGTYCGIPTDEYDEKIHNWRQYICSKHIDIMNINEYVPFIDYLPIADALTGTKKTVDYIFKPHYQYYDRTMETAREQAEVVSKFALSDIAKHTIAGDSGGWSGFYKYYRVTLDENHVIGVFAVQLPWMYNTGYNQESAESISNRATILNALSTIIGNSTDTYKIIMGDFNIPTDTDRSNLIALCANNGLTPANGGYLDWLRTTHLNYAIDNILVSNNILINNFESHVDWYDALSTDHYGVSADIILC